MHPRTLGVQPSRHVVKESTLHTSPAEAQELSPRAARQGSTQANTPRTESVVSITSTCISGTAGSFLSTVYRAYVLTRFASRNRPLCKGPVLERIAISAVRLRLNLQSRPGQVIPTDVPVTPVLNLTYSFTKSVASRAPRQQYCQGRSWKSIPEFRR
jgi:hypothetical protein